VVLVHLDKKVKGHLSGTKRQFVISFTIAVLFAVTAFALPVNSGQEAGATNDPPVADAGEDITGVLLNDQVMLDGSNSTDEDLDNCTWLWECTSHENVNVMDADSPVAKFSVFTEDVITFQLTLTDLEGESTIDTVEITPDINQDPELDTLNILPTDSGPEGPFYEIGSPLEFNATTASDPENRPLTFRWSSDVPGEGTFPSRASFTRKMNKLGWHNITLTVEDPNDGSTELVKYIRIREDRSPPVAIMTIWPIREVHNKGEVLRFDASRTEDINSLDTLTSMNFTWRTNLSGGRVIGYGYELNTTLEEGYHNISLEVVDTDGLTSSAWDQILIVNQAPDAMITTPEMAFRGGKRIVNVSETAFFSAYRSSDPNGDELEYHWDFGDGFTANGRNVTHTFAQFGSYNVTLEVDDGSLEKNLANDTVQVVANTIPTAVIEIPDEVLVDEPYLFSANGSGDEDGDPLIYRWDMNGDGTFDQTGFNTTYTFREEDEFIVTLRVDDGFAFAEAQIEVFPVFPNEPPVARILGWREGDDPIIVPLDDDEGEIELDASPSYDPDDDTNNNQIIDEREKNNLTFSWDLDAETDGTDTDTLRDNDFTKKGDTVRISVEGDDILRVRLNATDPRGVSSYLIIELKGDNPPVVTNLKSNKEQRLYVNSTVQFTSTADDEDSGQRNKLEYHWDFGDGTIVNETTSSYSHRFDEPGSYEVISWVTDGYLWASSRISVTVFEFEGLSIRFPRGGATISGSVLLRGFVDHFLSYEIDTVEVSIDGGDWDEAENWPDWEYRLQTWQYPDGKHRIEVRVQLDTGVEQTLEIEVTFSNTEETDNSSLITGIIAFLVVAAILGVVGYMLFGKKSNRTRDLMTAMPPPPGAGPAAPMPSSPGVMQRPPTPSAAPGTQPKPPTESKAEAPEKKGPKTIRVKCPACKKVFKIEDSGERPLQMTCTHCGVKGSISHVPGDKEEDEEQAEEKEEEKGPEPLSIICPSCSGVFELDEVLEEATCPFCNVTGQLDDETISELEERFSSEEEEITVRCPSCQGKFSIKSSDTEIICPFCGATGNVPK
jgi:PKD repeat protein/DNA-directed RNA polymerase subunit RPC12/RpoP